MSVRNIVKIDEEKCNGCGQCVTACAEGAIKITNGKARLISEIYCDGLGACIGYCPEGAIKIEKREAAEFDEEATKTHLAPKTKKHADFACPGTMVRKIEVKESAADSSARISSQLGQWPVQLNLLPPTAPYLNNADLLLVADCVPFAMGDFHNRFLKDKNIAVGCPKLDDVDFYIEKLTAILKSNKLNSLTVIRMEVPCCSGLTNIARQAIAKNGIKMSFEDVIIDLHGNVSSTQTIKC
ncbi:MAG: 4Fe-4S binding protein [Sedimentisphaerales bacterium]|nr:4Fe-4S binding protein [Sedimentisphaerales bacterium]